MVLALAAALCLPATGGADSDSRDATRQNAQLSVTALDRLVSFSDYEFTVEADETQMHGDACHRP